MNDCAECQSVPEGSCEILHLDALGPVVLGDSLAPDQQGAHSSTFDRHLDYLGMAYVVTNTKNLQKREKNTSKYGNRLKVSETKRQKKVFPVLALERIAFFGPQTAMKAAHNGVILDGNGSSER